MLDNVLQDGDIRTSRYAVTRRDRTIHARMREYLYELKHNPLLVTVLPVGTGVAVSVKVSPDGDGAGKRRIREKTEKRSEMKDRQKTGTADSEAIWKC